MNQPAEIPHFDENPWRIPPEALSKVEDLITEDDTPVDNVFSEKQQRLLTVSLHYSWRPGQSFVAMANVGLFYAIHQPPLVPDMLLSLGVSLPEELWQKHHRSYFTWEYGKSPEVVVEVVSNREGGELDRKREIYAQIGIRYYVVYDPQGFLSKTPLRLFKLADRDYIETVERWLPEIGLGLTLWTGPYEDRHDTWLRWCDQDKQPLPTGEEDSVQAKQQVEIEKKRADSAEQLAETAKQEAESAKQEADAAKQRTEQLAAQLRALGIDPDSV